MRAKRTGGTVYCRDWGFGHAELSDAVKKEIELAIEATLSDVGVHALAGQSEQEWMRVALEGHKDSAESRSLNIGIPIRVVIPFGSDVVPDPAYEVDLAPLLLDAVHGEFMDRKRVVDALRRLADVIDQPSSTCANPNPMA